MSEHDAKLKVIVLEVARLLNKERLSKRELERVDQLYRVLEHKGR